MGTYGQDVLVRCAAGDAGARLSIVREAVEAALSEWIAAAEPTEDEDLDDENVRSVYLESCRDSPWLVIADSEVGQWREPASELAKKVSRGLAEPVLAIAYGDEGVGLQVFVRGEDRGRWATDWGDDARLDPTIPDAEWRTPPEALADVLGEEHRDALAALPELAMQMMLVGPRPLFDRLGVTIDPHDDDDELGLGGPGDDPVFDGISALLRGAMAAAQTGESVDDLRGRLGLPEDAAAAPLDAMRALGEQARTERARAREEHVPNPSVTLWFERRER